MLRALTLSFVILAVAPVTCVAEITSPSVNCNDVSNKLAHPQSNSVAAGSSNSNEKEDAAAENELLEAANKSRELEGAPPLRMEESLRQAAWAHALRMVQKQQLQHQLSGELSLLERIGQVSPLKMDRVGENLAYATCAPDANEVLMRSPPHRQNLLDRGFNVAGIAAVWSKGKLYVVQDFGHEVPSYSGRQSAKLVGRAIEQTRQQAGLPELAEFSPAELDDAACSLSRENHPNAHLLAAAYNNRKIITYTQSEPEVLPQGALRLLRDPGVRQFAVGSCYARNAAYPTGMYWIAILLY
jgi:uncharacterized protein YkwD